MDLRLKIYYRPERRGINSSMMTIENFTTSELRRSLVVRWILLCGHHDYREIPAARHVWLQSRVQGATYLRVRDDLRGVCMSATS